MLELAGEGKSDGVGMTIANLRLVKYQEPKKRIKIREGDKFLNNGDFAQKSREPEPEIPKEVEYA